MPSVFLKLLPLTGALLIPLALLSLDSSTPTHSLNSADNPVVTIQVCRINVTPCQRKVNLPVDGEVTLGLYLNAAESLNWSEANSLIAWEVHLRLTGGAGAGLAVLVGPNGAPVREQGESGLVLDGLVRLSPDTDLAATDSYYRVQNSYDLVTGQLDFSVTLIGFSPSNSSDGLMFLEPGAQLLLGLITLQGVAPVSSDLVAAGSSGPPFQIVTITQSGAVTPRAVGGSGEPLSVANVGPAAEKARLRGLVWAQKTEVEKPPRPFRRRFTLTFWTAGAVPRWRGGEDMPALSFANLSAEESAGFTVNDLPPELVPAGVYDLRVNGVGTLSVLAPAVVVDTSGADSDNLPVVVSVDFGSLPSGDINGDNRVDTTDLSALKSGFGKDGKDIAFNPAADFNGDAVVDGQDFSLMAVNLYRVGQ